MTNNTSTYTDILSMNVSWLMEDLEPFENQFNILESMVCTIAIFITFVMAIIVHRAFYKLMKRLPGRDINQIIFPYMVRDHPFKTLANVTIFDPQFLSSAVFKLGKHPKPCFQFSFITFQVFLSMFMGSYSLYTTVVLWVYPLNDLVGDIACYMLVYTRNIGLAIIQVHSFFVALFRYMCLFHVNLLLRFSLRSNVSVQSIFNGM